MNPGKGGVQTSISTILILKTIAINTMDRAKAVKKSSKRRKSPTAVFGSLPLF
jgi:hypothetical protein